MRENRTSGSVRGALGNRRSYREMILNMDSSVIQTAFNVIHLLTNNSANRYIRLGFVIRALQIKESRFHLNQLLKNDGEKNRNPYETTETNIYLNSYYLNLFGALDCLAWGFHYEFDLIEGATEKNRKRNKISLFHDAYLERLRAINSDLVKQILEYKSWYQNVKEFRDPAAHRIPLYCPPGVVTNEHQQELESAKEDYENQDYSIDPDAYMNAMRKLSSVGEFRAIFLSYSEDGDTMFPLKRTLNEDYDPFWSLSNLVLTYLYDYKMKSTT